MRKLLLTAAGPNMRPVLLRHSLPRFSKYANLFSYDVHTEYLPSDSAQRDSKAKSARWQKISIIKSALQSYDIVLWLDADTLIERFDRDIVNDVKSDDFQGLVLHNVPFERRVNPNTGVWLLKSTDIANAFIDSILDCGMPQGRWADQAALMHTLGWNMGDANFYGAAPPQFPNQYTARTTWLPIGWNQPFVERRPNSEAYVGRPLIDNPYIVHYMSMTPSERLTYMSQKVMAQ